MLKLIFSIAFAAALHSGAVLAQSGAVGQEEKSSSIVRLVFQNESSPESERSQEFRTFLQSAETEMQRKGKPYPASVMESVRHDFQNGSIRAPAGTVFCDKILKSVVPDRRRLGSKNIVRLHFEVRGGGKSVSWTSSIREDADPAKLKYREFELIFVPEDLYRSLSESELCFG